MNYMFFPGVACVALACIGASTPLLVAEQEAKAHHEYTSAKRPIVIHWHPEGYTNNLAPLEEDTYSYLHVSCSFARGRKTKEIIASSHKVSMDAVAMIGRISLYQSVGGCQMVIAYVLHEEGQDVLEKKSLASSAR